MASKFLVQIVEKKTGAIVQWEPGRATEREFEDAVCNRIREKLSLLRPAVKITKQVRPVTLFVPVPALSTAKDRSFMDWLRDFLALNSREQTTAVERLVTSSVEVDVEREEIDLNEIVASARAAFKEVLYELKSEVRR